MSWSTRRRILIVSIITLVAAAILFAVFFPFVYKAPTCTDGKMNGRETGIDCGGSCAYLCTVDVGAPHARFVRPFSPSPGRTDVIAYIDNPNTGVVAKDARYTIELYGSDGTVIARKEGMMDILPGTTPVYVPNFVSGYADIARAFLTFDEASLKWYPYVDDRIVPTYNFDATVEGTTAPRITATLSNDSGTTVRNIIVIATVFDGNGTAIAATQTVVPSIAGQGVSGAVFTWVAPFAGTPVRIDIVPVVPLP